MVTAGASIALLRRARWLAWATIVWNVINAVVAIIAGSAGGGPTPPPHSSLPHLRSTKAAVPGEAKSVTTIAKMVLSAIS